MRINNSKTDYWVFIWMLALCVISFVLSIKETIEDKGAEEHHREQLPPVVPGEQPGEGGVGVGQDQYEVDDEAGRGGEHAEADLFPMIGLPLQIGVPVVHVRHVCRDRVPGRPPLNDFQQHADCQWGSLFPYCSSSALTPGSTSARVRNEVP